MTRAELRLDAGTASYPRGVLRGERPKRFFGDFLIGEKVTLRSKSGLESLRLSEKDVQMYNLQYKKDDAEPNWSASSFHL